MEKRKLIPVAIIVLILFLLAVSRFCSPQKNSPETDFNVSPPDIIQPVQAAESDKQEKKETPKKQEYEIKEYKGNLAVFESGEKKPFRVTDIEVKNLPEADQKELKSGIKVSDYAKLQTLLEDYLS